MTHITIFRSHGNVEPGSCAFLVQ